MTLEDIVAQLRRSGYTDARSNRSAWRYNLRGNALEIFSRPDSYFDQEGGSSRHRRPDLPDHLDAR